MPRSNRYSKFTRRAKEAGVYYDYLDDQSRLTAEGHLAEDARQIAMQNWVSKVEAHEVQHQTTGHSATDIRRRRLVKLADRVSLTTTATKDEIAAWVLNHLDAPFRFFDHSSVPCRGAIVLLLEAEGDNRFRQNLMRGFMTGVGKAASRAKEELSERDQSIVDLSAELAEEHTKGPNRESVIPAEAN